MIVGCVLMVIAVYSLLKRPTTGNDNGAGDCIKNFGMKFQTSSPVVRVLIFGVGLFVSPATNYLGRSKQGRERESLSRGERLISGGSER
ncbi:hypothetical protein HNO88_003864 [Novosphingobium chloroacetimidivorans]|uniref:Uncharacterized protein n=1 Tax=Novosphingobium chloroacetimidivorans TaxID=1428314 RepID=A0A7W7KDL5_9SPHN|nr:hypothetical protein [Novosphingobium chloroacetimidivorans]